MRILPAALCIITLAAGVGNSVIRRVQCGHRRGQRVAWLGAWLSNQVQDLAAQQLEALQAGGASPLWRHCKLVVDFIDGLRAQSSDC